MLKRFVTPLALLAAVGTASGAAFAQAQPAPAPYGMPAAPENPNGPGGQGPDGQGPNGSMQHRPNRVQLALRSLDLNDQQRDQIKGFQRAFRQSRQSPNPETRQQMLAQIKGVLTPQQRTRFEAQMRQGGQNGPGMNGPDGGPGGPDMNGPGGPGGPEGPQGQGGQGQGGQGQGGPPPGQGQQ